jgi:hypothetical protein
VCGRQNQRILAEKMSTSGDLAIWGSVNRISIVLSNYLEGDVFVSRTLKNTALSSWEPYFEVGG